MPDTIHTAEIIPFPTRCLPTERVALERVSEDGQQRLQAALTKLDAALAEQKEAVAVWRASLGELGTAVSSLGGSLSRYQDGLGALRTNLDGAKAEANRLETWADVVIAKFP
jgi:septal ring factor EnvC (AmiA/AmiB activator)